MPSAGQISFVYDQTRMRWMTSLTSGRFQLPLNLTEGNTVDFVFRLSNNGVLFTPALTPVWIFGIKDADDPNGDFLIQVNSATAASGVFTFVVELASAELQTWLATATSQSYAAIQITDSANDIATGPLLCQIEPNQNDTGTTPTSANGTLSVAAGKTVTFPQSLTFPSDTGTDNYQLTTNGAGVLTWEAGTNAPGGSTTQVQYNNAGSFAGITGATTNGTALTLVAPVLGAATATSINGITITPEGAGTLTMDGDISTHGPSGGPINTSNYGGFINTSVGGGSIDTRGTGSIELGVTGTRTTFTGAASGTNKSIALPDLSGTVVVTAATSATATQALFAQATGFPAYRGIATADIATALTTPGAIGGTTASTGAFTTLSGTSTLTLGVAGPTGTAGTVVLKNATNAFTTTIVPSVVTASQQLNLPLITGTDTVAVLGLTQTFTGNKTFSGTVSCGSTLAVSSTTTMTGRLTANGGITVVGGSVLLTTNSALSDNSQSNTATLTNSPGSGNPAKWISINDHGTARYIPTWELDPP